MNSAPFRRRVRQIHRWLGLIIGLQVLMWVSGGMIMSLLNLQDVRGATWAADHAPTTINADAIQLDIAHVLVSHSDLGITEIRLRNFLDHPVYELKGHVGTQLVDAVTGELRTPVTEAEARAVAVRDQLGDSPIRATEWVTEPELEFRGRDVPLWRVWLDDGRNTAIYIAPDTGQVVARRNDWWRIFDFVWMLHIMDYEEREDFNHPLLIAFAVSAVLFVVSGLFMLVLSFTKARVGPTVG